MTCMRCFVFKHVLCFWENMKMCFRKLVLEILVISQSLKALIVRLTFQSAEDPNKSGNFILLKPCADPTLFLKLFSDVISQMINIFIHGYIGTVVHFVYNPWLSCSSCASETISFALLAPVYLRTVILVTAHDG